MYLGAVRSMTSLGVWKGSEGSLSHSEHCHPYCFVFFGILNQEDIICSALVSGYRARI